MNINIRNLTPSLIDRIKKIGEDKGIKTYSKTIEFMLKQNAEIERRNEILMDKLKLKNNELSEMHEILITTKIFQQALENYKSKF